MASLTSLVHALNPTTYLNEVNGTWKWCRVNRACYNPYTITLLISVFLMNENSNMPAKGGSASGGKHTLIKLPYAYDALEPYIDALTMEIHHTKHHQTYVDKLNAALEKYPDLQEKSIEDLLRNLVSLQVAEADRAAIKNHGGGIINHNLFWQNLDPANIKDEKLVAEINQAFGSVEDFKKQFTDLAAKLFGSGWVWLVRNTEGGLELYQTPNQDSPYSKGHTPIICLDVWEHAYYLKYQNRRVEYIENWWKVLKLI